MKKIVKHYLTRNFRSARRDLSFDNLVTATLPFLEAVDTPVSLGVHLRLKYKAYAEYLEMELDPQDYKTPNAFAFDYQCVKLFSKAEFFPSVFDTKEAAAVSFIQSGMDCLATNRSFNLRKDPDFSDPAISAVMYGAQRKISKILGACPRLADLSISFGPGNNVGLHKTTSIYDKLTAVLTFTGNLRRTLPELLESVPAWASLRAKGPIPSSPGLREIAVQEVAGSSLGFVPKNAKTMRTICTEPLLNSFVQLGIGKHMRAKLRRAGCNLNSQWRNQDLARVGSITNNLATIDLSSASDTISYLTVLELLPLPWFDLLDRARSPCYTYEGKYYSFSKFSSMGNGYTFELESLIFLALSRAVCDHLMVSSANVSVYGDDIIIPVEALSLLRKVLSFCGFKVNETKSYHEGPFRESCGKDWFLGHQVRPLFLKRRPTNATLMGWCNHVWRVDGGLYDFRWQALYDGLYGLVETPFRSLRGPDGFGDGHFVVEWDNRLNVGHSKRRRGWEGYGFYTLGSSPTPRRLDDDAVYAAALYAAENGRTVKPLEKQRISHTSIDGFYCALTRGRVRTVVQRAFHPWNTGSE